MNQFWKLIFSILGGANVVISFFIPIAVVLLWINLTNQTGMLANVLIVAGSMASAFRGIKIMMGWNKE